ncbi:hypothetical protein DPMN_100740 [Dreissena polymorpha]|uniref:Uncharacterized protein n=1 Tax=Dreissena polymorpha TaxID=45954 RepID=A0A9D4R7P7_DREPO|nr:hypothetical protein DPMN_100740 [Dreissena polymorpha]
MSCPMPVNVIHATERVSSTSVGSHVTYTCEATHARLVISRRLALLQGGGRV